MVYEKKTKLECKKVFDKADEFFNQDWGLESSKDEECANYTGGGGHIKISCCQDENKRTVNIETREWDRQVKDFLKKI